MKELLTVKDVAKILGLSTNTVYKYVNSGVIRSSRAQLQQGRFRVPKKAVEEFLGAPLEDIHDPISDEIPHESQATHPNTTEDKYDHMIKSLLQDKDNEPQGNPQNTVESHARSSISSHAPEATQHAWSRIDQHAQDTAQSSSAPSQTDTHAGTPTFAVKTARILLLLGLSLFVVNLAYFSPPHPIALFTQLSILFLFLLLSYQFGGMRKRIA
jgi:excisionase family DNA binding protein